jgi:tellurite resistance protein
MRSEHAVHIVVILDVKPMEGEARREPEQIIEELEAEIERVAVDVPNASGTFSAHEIKVAGIGKDVAAAQQSLAERKQYARQD